MKRCLYHTVKKVLMIFITVLKQCQSLTDRQTDGRTGGQNPISISLVFMLMCDRKIYLCLRYQIKYQLSTTLCNSLFFSNEWDIIVEECPSFTISYQISWFDVCSILPTLSLFFFGSSGIRAACHLDALCVCLVMISSDCLIF